MVDGRLDFIFFFFNDTATTEIYTLSLHDALPISAFFQGPDYFANFLGPVFGAREAVEAGAEDRKSTRLNSSHGYISYALFCLKKKKRVTVEIRYCLSCRPFLHQDVVAKLVRRNHS